MGAKIVASGYRPFSWNPNGDDDEGEDDADDEMRLRDPSDHRNLQDQCRTFHCRPRRRGDADDFPELK